MRDRQVGNVNIVTHTGPIGRRVVAAKDGNALNFSLGCLQHQRD